MIPRCICLPTIERRARSYAENRCHTQRSIKQSEASEPLTVEERSLSAAVRLVRFFSAAFATIFMSWGSVTVPSSAKRLAERDSSQQHAAQQRDAGSTTLNCLVDLDRLEPHPVQAQLVQDQAAASGGCGAAAGWLAALSEPPERLLDRLCAPG